MEINEDTSKFIFYILDEQEYRSEFSQQIDTGPSQTEGSIYTIAGKFNIFILSEKFGSEEINFASADFTPPALRTTQDSLPATTGFICFMIFR